MSDLAFDCVTCGACCFSRHPRYLVLLPEDQALCAVYDHRPEACRAFRAGSFECQKAIRANGVMGEKVRAVPAA